VADRITGYFYVLTQNKSSAEGNDATLFEDDNGKVYLFTPGSLAWRSILSTP